MASLLLASLLLPSLLLPSLATAQQGAGEKEQESIARLRAEVAALKRELLLLRTRLEVITSTPGSRAARRSEGSARNPGLGRGKSTAPVGGITSLAGVSCPLRFFVTGFDQAGQVICSDRSGMSAVQRRLEEGKLLRSAYEGLEGVVFPVRIDAVRVNPKIDLYLSGEMLSLAFCLPAVPAPRSSRQNCLPDMEAHMYLLEEEVVIQMRLTHLFSDFQVSWSGLSQGRGWAYLVFSDVTVSLRAPLVDQGDGNLQIGEVLDESARFRAGAVDGEIEPAVDSSGVFELFHGVLRDKLIAAVKAAAPAFFSRHTNHFTETFPHITP